MMFTEDFGESIWRDWHQGVKVRLPHRGSDPPPTHTHTHTRKHTHTHAHTHTHTGWRGAGEGGQEVLDDYLPRRDRWREGGTGPYVCVYVCMLKSVEEREELYVSMCMCARVCACMCVVSKETYSSVKKKCVYMCVVSKETYSSGFFFSSDSRL